MLVNINQRLWALIVIIIVLFIFEHLRTSVLHQDIEIRLYAQEALARSLAYIVCTFCSLPSPLRGVLYFSLNTQNTTPRDTAFLFLTLFFTWQEEKKKKKTLVHVSFYLLFTSILGQCHCISVHRRA